MKFSSSLTKPSDPAVKVWDVAYVRFQKPDLGSMERYLQDFGLHLSARTADTIYMRGAGPTHHIYIAEHGRRSQYLGLGFAAADRTDLERIATVPGASKVQASPSPAEVEILSPVTTPCRVICLGANYRQHMIDVGMDPDVKTFNMFFTKSSALVAPPHTEVRRPAHVRLLDYEIELALVIGRDVTVKTEVTRENLHEYVAGITIANDVSARDIQIPETQFFKGKSYRTFCPLGPYLCLLDRDDVPYLDRLELTLLVNGEVRQHDTTANRVFKPAETLSELSEFSDLSPGECCSRARRQAAP